MDVDSLPLYLVKKLSSSSWQEEQKAAGFRAPTEPHGGLWSGDAHYNKMFLRPFPVRIRCFVVTLAATLEDVW